MTVLPDEYHSALTQLLENLLSTDNTIRAEAEKSLDQNWTSKDNVELLLVFWLNKHVKEIMTLYVLLLQLCLDVWP